MYKVPDVKNATPGMYKYKVPDVKNATPGMSISEGSQLVGTGDLMGFTRREVIEPVKSLIMGPVDGILNMLLVRLWPSRFRLSCAYLAALFVLVGSSHIGFEPSAASYGAPKCQSTQWSGSAKSDAKPLQPTYQRRVARRKGTVMPTAPHRLYAPVTTRFAADPAIIAKVFKP